MYAELPPQQEEFYSMPFFPIAMKLNGLHKHFFLKLKFGFKLLLEVI